MPSGPVAPGLDVTVAQATIMTTMMLVAHALPIEVKIAQKAGTTSLSNYLGEHPSLRNPLCMEFTFFSDPAEQRQGLQAALQ